MLASAGEQTLKIMGKTNKTNKQNKQTKQTKPPTNYDLISILPRVARAMFLGIDRPPCFISIGRFCSSKNPSAKITSRSEL